MNSPLDPDVEVRAIQALAALAQTSRLRIFRLLVGAGADGLHPGQMAGALDLPANALSFHLKELHQCNLISQEREGRHLRYRANMEAMGQLMTFLTAHCCDGKPCPGMPAPEYSVIFSRKPFCLDKSVQ